MQRHTLVPLVTHGHQFTCDHACMKNQETVLCDHLEGWEGDARGRGYGDICICIADSLRYKAETNTPL